MIEYKIYKCEKCGEIFSDQHNGKAKEACLAHEKEHKVPLCIVKELTCYSPRSNIPSGITVTMEDGSNHTYISKDMVKLYY